jgi:hypothetical protein
MNLKSAILPVVNAEASGSVVVEALCHKPDGRGFEIRWGEYMLSLYLILPTALGREGYLASNRNCSPRQRASVASYG